MAINKPYLRFYTIIEALYVHEFKDIPYIQKKVFFLVEFFITFIHLKFYYMPTPTKRASRRGTTELKASHFDINDRVKLIRLSRKLTQPQFSQLTGLTVSYIKAIERYAYTPTVSALKLIHDTCEVTYDWLIDGNK